MGASMSLVGPAVTFSVLASLCLAFSHHLTWVPGTRGGRDGLEEWGGGKLHPNILELALPGYDAGRGATLPKPTASLPPLIAPHSSCHLPGLVPREWAVGESTACLQHVSGSMGVDPAAHVGC